jgi:hypothetical protein
MNLEDPHPDEVDELFQSLEWIDPPSDIRRVVLSNARLTRLRDTARRRWIAFDAGILVALGAASYRLGCQLYWTKLLGPTQTLVDTLTDAVTLPSVVAVVACTTLAAVVTRRIRRLSRGNAWQ